MKWSKAVASMALLSVFATEAFAAEKFACAEYFQATPAGQKKAEAGVKGTLIFDELLNLPMHAQNLLLDFVQFGTYRPLGFDGPEPRVAQTRIIAATNGDLGAAIRGGRFRADLFHRLASTILELPPLRCRREDILPLAHTALRRVDPHRSWTLSVPLQRLLVSPALEWPGNVRQLEHVVLRARERALVRTPMATELDLEHVEARHLERVLVLSGVRTSLSTLDCTPEAHLEVAWQNLQSARDRIQTREAELIQQAILVSGGVVAHAAKELGIARTTLASRMAVLGIRSGRRDSSLSLKCPPTPSTPLLDTETVGRRLG